MSVNINESGTLRKIAGQGVSMFCADSPVGSIVPYGGTVAPTDWFLCQGQELDRTEYADLFAVIGESFGTPSSITKFKLPDLREATLKGTGLTSKSSAHYDSDGLALGEFIDDRVQDHQHSLQLASGGSTSVWGLVNTSTGQDAGGTLPMSTGRHGDTTEVKAVGVNFIIKAKQTALPADLQAAAEDAGETAASTAVNKVVSYSTIETLTGGTWIDGKPIYRTVIDIGTLPDTTAVSVAHGISSLGTVVRTYGCATNGVGQLPLPFVSISDINSIMYAILQTTIDINVGSDRSSYSGWIAIEYTKTTD